MRTIDLSIEGNYELADRLIKEGYNVQFFFMGILILSKEEKC